MSEKNYSVVKKAFSLLWEDIKAAKWVIIFIIAYFVLFRRFTHSVCPVVGIIGYPCPACGLTRAGFALLHLEFGEAFHIHPFIFPIVGFVIVWGWNRYILGRKMAEWMKWCAVAIMIGMLIYYIWRMYRYFPGEPPISYYSYNLMQRLWEFVRHIAGGS